MDTESRHLLSTGEHVGEWDTKSHFSTKSCLLRKHETADSLFWTILAHFKARLVRINTVCHDLNHDRGLSCLFRAKKLQAKRIDVASQSMGQNRRTKGAKAL